MNNKTITNSDEDILHFLKDISNIKLPPDKTNIVKNFLEYDLRSFIAKLKTMELSVSLLNKQDKDIQSQLNESIIEILKIARILEETISHKLAMNRIKQYFRDCVGFSAYQSKLVKRAYEKPCGYPGDFELLENIYNNKPISEKMGFYWDNYFLSDGLAVSVRERKDKTTDFLKGFICSSSNSNIRILNLACGSSRDLKELFEELNPQQRKSLEITCLDQDSGALKYSKSALNKYAVNINYVKEDILRFFKRNTNSLDAQHVIYSIGLADYLPDRVLKSFLASCYEKLAQGGKLFIAHKDYSVYFPIVQDWFCNWSFYPRLENQLHEIIKSIVKPKTRIDSFRGQNKIMYYFSITK